MHEASARAPVCVFARFLYGERAGEMAGGWSAGEVGRREVAWARLTFLWTAGSQWVVSATTSY